MHLRTKLTLDIWIVFGRCVSRLNLLTLVRADRRFLQVLSSIYKAAHPVLEPEDNSVTVVLLEDEASKA